MGPVPSAALCLALLCAAASGWAQEEPAAVSLDACRDDAVRAVQKRYENVRDVSAGFEQTTRAVGVGSSLPKDSVSRGRVLLAKPGKMRWTYETPQRSLVVSDGETLWVYDPLFGEAQKMPAGGGFLSGAAAQFLLGSGDMGRDFAVRAIACGDSEVELELVPREAATFEKLSLLVDPASGEVRSTRVVDLLGNVVRVAFEGMRFDTDPPPDAFRFDPPDGVRVIELAP